MLNFRGVSVISLPSGRLLETDPWMKISSSQPCQLFHGRIGRILIRFVWSDLVQQKRSSTKTSLTLKTQSQLKSDLNLYQNSTSNQSQLIITITSLLFQGGATPLLSLWNGASTLCEFSWIRPTHLVWGGGFVFTQEIEHRYQTVDGWEGVSPASTMAMLCSFMLHFRGCKFFPQAKKPTITIPPTPKHVSCRCPGGGAVRTSGFYLWVPEGRVVSGPPSPGNIAWSGSQVSQGKIYAPFFKHDVELSPQCIKHLV